MRRWRRPLRPRRSTRPARNASRSTVRSATRGSATRTSSTSAAATAMSGWARPTSTTSACSRCRRRPPIADGGRRRGGLVDFGFTPDEERFREEVRAFIREHLPRNAGGDGVLEGGAANLPALWKWNRDLLAKRWVGFNWPAGVGGGGGSLVEQMILKEEMARVKAPPLGISYMGLA